MNKNIERYYELVDEFLLKQFDFAMERESIKSVQILQKDLIDFLESFEFSEPNLELAKVQNLQQLKGLTVNVIGLTQFRKIKIDDCEIENKLNKERVKIGKPDFLHILEETMSIDFDDKGLELEQSPASWLESNNSRIPLFEDPNSLKDILIDLDGFNSRCIYIFEQSPERS